MTLRDVMFLNIPHKVVTIYVMTLRERLPRRSLSRRLRYIGLTSHEQGQRLPGEEVFLRGLYEIRSGDNQYDAAINVFGRDQSVQSRAYRCCVKHIYENLKDLVIDNLRWWRDNGFMEESRTKIWEKIEGADLFYISATH